MTFFRNSLAAATLALASLAPVAADDFDDVRKAVENYFAATEEGRPGLLRQTFLPSLEVQYVAGDGSLGRITSDDYIGNIQPGKKASRKGHVVSVDITGNAAVAKAEVVTDSRIYTDYLLLLKLEDGWRISNKIATFRPKSDG